MRGELPNFLYGAKRAIQNNIKAGEFPITTFKIKLVIKEYAESKNLLTESEITDFIVDYTKVLVEDDGDHVYDLNSVGWFMGLICQVITLEYQEYLGKFDELFSDAWVSYFPH